MNYRHFGHREYQVTPDGKFEFLLPQLNRSAPGGSMGLIACADVWNNEGTAQADLIAPALNADVYAFVFKNTEDPDE